MNEGHLPGGPVVENLPCSVGGRGFDPWSGNEALTCLRAAEPVCHNCRASALQLRLDTAKYERDLESPSSTRLEA